MQTPYVAGFMFDYECNHVALILKNRPLWQAGKLNAIGGHLENKETPIEAMVREFEEETGLKTEHGCWHNFVQLSGEYFVVNFFVAIGDIRELKSTTDEQVMVFHKDCITTENAIPNLTYLIPMAILAMTGPVPKLFIEERPW